jgi:PKHD-type hydroxylase
MKGQWCYYKSYFPPSYCDSIIEKSKNLTFNEATMGEDGKTINNTQRKSDVAWIYSKDFPELYDEVWKLEREANKEWFGFHIDNLEYIQLARYNGTIGAEYKKHHDVFWINKSTRHRKLSAVIQLSNPDTYTGGEFKLYDCDEYPNPEDIKQQGTVIFFPSFIYHEANPVTSGIRHSLALWFEGPKWR